jgi:hypothetical protein
MKRAQAKKCFHSGKTFRELAFSQKLRFIGKSIIFFASGGFVFPTMWID